MFNFASKVFNAIGDLVSDVDPAKPAQPSQPSAQQPSPQRRFSGGDARFYQIKSQPRFPAPQTQDDHLPRLGSSGSGTSASGGIGIGGGHVRPSSAPVYRYPTATAHTTPSYRPERYEESKFKAPDIDYNEDGYNVGRNYNGSERQSSYITELQKEYGMYREHDVDDANDYEEEDRYSLGYENEGNRRRRSLSSERENSQLKNTEEYNENVIYSDTADRNHYARESHHQSKNEPSTGIYDTHQLFSADSYSSSETHQNKNDFAQFTSGGGVVGVASTSSWISEEVDDYNKSRRRRKSNSESDKQFRIDHEDKISPSPPSQDEDARNSSRSESESSDEISFGEALATGLIPPNITPEIAARMNIEFINHPKAVIESFYGHSPGEVYTIPEEEDEICSPTGADGVTSLRKQRMASARVESSSHDQKELQNQRGRIPSTNQQSDLRLKQKYSGQSLDSNSELERQLISDDMKENRPTTVSEFVTSQDAHKMFNPAQKFQPDDHRPGVKQPFRYVQSTTQPDTAQFNYGPEKPVQQQAIQPQQQKPYKSETRPQTYQPDIRPQMYQPEVRPQIYQADGRPQVYQYGQPQSYPNEVKPPGYTSGDRSQPSFQDRSQLYQGDRAPQNYQSDNRTQYPAQAGQPPQNYPPENIQPYQTDSRSQQQPQQQPQPYQTDTMNQGYQQIPQNNRAQGYQPDNRPQNYQSAPQQAFPQQQPPQNYPKDGRTQGYQQQPQQQQQQQQPQQPQQQTDRPQNYPISDRPTQPYPLAENQGQGYQQGYQPQNYPPDNRPPQGYQQGHPTDNRPPGYQQGSQGHPSAYQPTVQGQQPVYQQGVQGHPPDGRPMVYPQGQTHPADNRSQVYPPDGRPQGFPQNGRSQQVYPPDNRPYPDRSQNYPPDNRPVQGFQPDNRSQPYPADPRSQPYQQDSRQKPQDNRRLPQSQQYDDQTQRPPNQNYAQGGPYRDSDNHYQQFQKHPNDLQDDRRLPPQGVPQQDYPDQYRRQPSDPRDDPQDLENRQFAEQGQNNRRRLPLRKHNSEERYGSYQQQDYDRNRGPQSHESPGRMQHEEEYDAQGRPVRRFPERLKHRSSSLEHDRDDQYYGRSRSSSFERSHYPDDAEYEEYSGRDQRRASLEHKKMLPRVAQEHSSSRQGASSKQVQSRMQSKPGFSSSDKTRIHKQGSWQESSTQDHSRSRVQQDSRKDENFCLQHKKFTGTSSSVSKPTRRVLPKEPSGQSQRKTIKRSQSQDKSTTTTKSEDSSHQRTGILSNAARKTERSGQLKITFSDPISNLLNPKKNTASSVAGHSRTESSSKNTSTKSDKPVITSNILPQSKNYIYPLPVVKTPNQPEPASRSPIPPTPSSLYRNQSQFDQSLRDSRLALSPNTRSLPIPIAQRTCSLDRYSSSETNLNTSPYYHDQFSRPGSAPGLMYEPVHQSGNQPNPLSLYELHALKKEEKFWSDIYSALPADMKHLITNRGIGGPMSRKLSSSNASFSSVVSSPATVIGGSHPAERASLENRIMQRSMMAKGQTKGPNQGRDNFQSSLGERIGNRLRMLHEMKEQAAAGFNNRRKMADTLSRRSASDGEYSFASTTNFPLCWNLTRRPHSDSAIDLIDRLEVQNSPTRVSGSAYNSSEYLTKVVDKSQSYLTSPCTNVPPSPAPVQPVRMLRDTALRGDHTESLQVHNYPPLGDNRSGFFSCLQNIESLTRQYEEEDRMRTELDYDDEIYSEPGMPDPEYGGRYHRGLGHPRRRDQQF